MHIHKTYFLFIQENIEITTKLIKLIQKSENIDKVHYVVCKVMEFETKTENLKSTLVS